MKVPHKFCTEDILGGYSEGVTRRDPSPVIKVSDCYYCWYSRTTAGFSGYTATIWYATSTDGWVWEEQGQALARGKCGDFDEHAVFTPSIFIWNDRYYLSYTGVPEPFYQGLNGQPYITKTAIGLACSSSPDGPWKRVSCNPVLSPSSDPDSFDSLRVDDTCFVVSDKRIWMYYKGRQEGMSPQQTKMGVAVATNPCGPYEKISEKPVVDGGHEVCVWPTCGGIASLHCDIGPAANTLQWSHDGLDFNVITTIVPPKAPAPYRSDNFISDREMQLDWGICMVSHPEWPWLSRFSVGYK